MTNQNKSTTGTSNSNHTVVDDQFVDDIQEDADVIPLSAVDEGDSSDNRLSSSSVPSVVGEQSVSGDMADPESDDDVLENAHMVGLALDEDEEHPKPLDIAADVEKAEDYHKNRE